MRDERSPNKELVNCMCGVPEEDGLMIQCDLCMCWQHGLCNMIETEEQVPEKYVCYICLHPARERQSRKYAHDQDWLKEGTLPRMPIRRNQGRVVRTNTELLLKETHDITAAILHLQQVIHSLRVKINIAEKSDHPKLYLWSKRWESDDDKSLFPSKQEEDIKPETADVKQEFAIETLALANEEIKSELDTEAKSGTTDGDMKPGSSNENGKLGSEEENMKPASSTDDELKSGSQEDADLHLALNLPLSQSELEHLANTVEHKLRSTEESQAVVPMVSTPVPQAKAPEPEAPIQLASCRLVLLEHIERYQAKLEARLAELELRADQLEARDPELAGVCERDQTSNTKDTLRMLQRDLDSVNKISEYATSD
ncbi:hypothetical protein B566_EDAN010495 [Ephemera danica]|nr:hypothetical protein B566_EDAN010495 [Ephemera danica]